MITAPGRFGAGSGMPIPRLVRVLGATNGPGPIPQVPLRSTTRILPISASPLPGPSPTGFPAAATSTGRIVRDYTGTPLGEMATAALAAQVVAEHRYACKVAAMVEGADERASGSSQRPDDAGAIAVRLVEARDPGTEHIAVSRREWAAVTAERRQLEHTVDGLADAANRLMARLADVEADRDRFATKFMDEYDAHTSTMAALDQTRATLASSNASPQSATPLGQAPAPSPPPKAPQSASERNVLTARDEGQ